MQEGQARMKSSTSWYQTWASRFVAIRQSVVPPLPGQPRRWVEADEDVQKRDVLTQKTLDRIAAGSIYRERLVPTFKRLHKTIWKCAALVALTQKRRRIDMDDYIIALEQVEEWLENILHMVEITDMTPRARQANRLYELIERSGGSMARTAINRIKEYQGDQRGTQGLIDELVAQGRAEVLNMPTGAVVRVVPE
jgi:hypothetical protein